MSEHVIDTVLRVRVEHRPGQLARLASTIADAGGLIGDISTIRVGETATLRDVTIETVDEDQTRRVVACVGEIDGVEVVEAENAPQRDRTCRRPGQSAVPAVPASRRD